MKKSGVPLRLVDPDKPNPIMAIESRPSRFSGISYHLVLSYKEFHAERLLPPDFMGMDQTGKDLTVLPLAEEMRKELAPVLIAEDAPPAEPDPEPPPSHGGLTND